MDVIAAAVIENGRLLVVSKQAAPDVFYLPGGKPDPDEPEHRTLERELAEEIQARPLQATSCKARPGTDTGSAARHYSRSRRACVPHSCHVRRRGEPDG